MTKILKIIQIIGTVTGVIFLLVCVKSISDFGLFHLLTILSVLMVICSIGVVRLRIWGQKSVLLVCSSGFVYFVINNYVFQKPSFILPAGFLGLWLSIFIFFVLPSVRENFVIRASGGKNILIVDDDKMLLRSLEVQFARCGLGVLLAETGEDGLIKAKKYKPDLIILDVVLPGLKGRDVCHLLKDSPDTQEIPVIFLTAKDSLDDIQAEMQAGGILHLTKPVKFWDLYQDVKKLLGL